jgi:mono/diheme cytochrome c family protein
LIWLKTVLPGRINLRAQKTQGRKQTMRRPFSCHAIALVGALAVALPAAAQTVDYGRAEFAANCSGCHGASGKGDGHFRQFLNRAPADLTQLARKNGGVFPMKRVHDAIDGRNPLPMHGAPGEMPIWGDAYAVQAQREGMVAGMTQEVYVRNKVNLLIDYVFRLQQT